MLLSFGVSPGEAFTRVLCHACAVLLRSNLERLDFRLGTAQEPMGEGSIRTARAVASLGTYRGVRCETVLELGGGSGTSLPSS